jgi:RimJ/RimL family protein N-acetyltransferase
MMFEMEIKNEWIERQTQTLTSDYVRGSISYFPGNGDVLISHNVYCDWKSRGQGHGDRAHKERLIHMKEQIGASYVLCTVVSDNEAQIKIMKKNGWKVLDEYWNESYEHNVCIFGKNLQKEETECDIPDYGILESDV